MFIQIVIDSNGTNTVTDVDLDATEQMLESIKSSGTPHAETVKELEKSSNTIVIAVNRDGLNDSTPGDDTNMTTAEMIASADGTGGDVYIRFDPYDTSVLTDGTSSDPESTLVHELCGHAVFQSKGTNPYNPNDYSDGESREVQASAIENEYRAAKGLPQRQKYGIGAVGPNNEGWCIPQATVPKINKFKGNKKTVDKTIKKVRDKND